MSVQLTNNEALVPHLSKLLEKENNIYDENLAKVCVAWKERSQAVSLIWSVNQKFGFHTDTLACTVQILDRFLAAVKVQSKYLRCVALASFHIAAKLLEEAKYIPTISNIIEAGGCTFSQKDLSRMESIILGKLNWNVKTPTAYDFIETLFGILCNEHKEFVIEKEIHMMPVFQEMCALLQNCICSSRFSEYKNSTLALSVIGTVVAKHYPNWYTCLAPLQQQTKTPIKDFLHCRDLVKSISLIRKQPGKPRRRPAMLIKCPALSPIKENPFELEYAMFCQRRTPKKAEFHLRSSSGALVEHGVQSGQVDNMSPRFHGEVDDVLPAAKRPRIFACGVQCRMDDDTCPVLTSPTKSIRI